MISFFKQDVFIKSLDMKASTALKVIKILVVNTGVPWTFQETPFINQKRT
jgi:hypothetical protein